MGLKFKKDAEPVGTDDPYYDLTSGGYIKPADLLEPDDAKRVQDAANLLEQFFEEAEEAGLLEFM